MARTKKELGSKWYQRTSYEILRDRNLVAMWLLMGLTKNEMLEEHKKHCKTYALTANQIRLTIKQINEQPKEYNYSTEEQLKQLDIVKQQYLAEFLKQGDIKGLDGVRQTVKTQHDMMKDTLAKHGSDLGNRNENDHMQLASGMTIESVIEFIQSLDSESLIEMVLIYQKHKLSL